MPDPASYERLLEESRERFEDAVDFTVSVEEKFALTRALTGARGAYLLLPPRPAAQGW